MEEKKEAFLEIEKMADLAEARRKEGDTNISFNNEGEMVVDNRTYRRDNKRIWRSVMENQKSIHFYTQKKNKTSRKGKKLERQNRKKGRN